MSASSGRLAPAASVTSAISVSQPVATGEVRPRNRPATTRTVLPSPVSTGSVAGVVMHEAGRAFFLGGRQRDPALQAVQRLARDAVVGRGALRMGDAAPGASSS